MSRFPGFFCGGVSNCVLATEEKGGVIAISSEWVETTSKSWLMTSSSNSFVFQLSRNPLATFISWDSELMVLALACMAIKLTSSTSRLAILR